MAKAGRPRAVPDAPLALGTWGEWLGWISLAAMTAFFLSASWRKWPDPLIDFGRELYVPWRLAHGALLYKDVNDFYGPLSQYLNAALFTLFGPGLMILVFANLAVFAAIVVALYLLLRRAWGVGGAVAGTGIFISVFGFGQYGAIGNYNYATPYSHEATRGVLLCLLLIASLLRWIELPSVSTSALCGGLLGLTAVLKPEILLAAGVLSATAFALAWRSGKRANLAAKAAWVGCTALPTVAFAAYFSTRAPWREGLSMACRAWSNLSSSTRLAEDAIQLSFLGLDHPGQNLKAHLLATGVAIALIAAIAVASWLVERGADSWRRVFLPALILAGIGWLASGRIDWIDSGQCLLGLTVVYLVLSGAALLRGSQAASRPDLTARFLIALLAAALLARMLLNGRIFQYGFYQAAVAGAFIPAAILGELPERLALRRWGTIAAVGGLLLLLVPGVLNVAGYSQNLLNSKTYAIGDGHDEFYAYRPDVSPLGRALEALLERLRQIPPGQTLLALPEGEMINYLARMPSPVAPFEFYAASVAGGREAAVVAELRQHPPDWVTIVSRDLREYGIQRYGEAPGKGQLILQWVSANYRQDFAVGGDPLDDQYVGAVLLRRKSPARYLGGN